MRIRILFCLIFLLYSDLIFSQKYDWWNEKHNWDGYSSWRSYLTFSAEKMGPNALPVPDINRGDFSDIAWFSGGVQHHFSPGDKTTNFLADLLLPVVPGRAGVYIHYVPWEHYSTDTITRDIRASRSYDTEGSSFGDVYFTTYVQILKDRERLPDIMFTINLKTASGTNVGSARHTDTPGYYFDISMGKTFSTGGKWLTHWRPHLMGGFYSYQTNRSDYMQNDAVLFGFGVRTGISDLFIDNQIGGYLGYFGNGDQPVVYRLNVSSSKSKKLSGKLNFQYGIHDVPWTSLSFSLVYTLRKFSLPLIKNPSDNLP